MKLSVIIIDDSPLQLLISSKLIRQNKHLNLIGAYTNPMLGLMAVNGLDVDILLLDVEMPEIDGFALKSQITKPVEVIMNSTKPSFELRAYSVGAIDFINKPLKAERLHSSIAKVMKEEKFMGNQEKAFSAVAS